MSAPGWYPDPERPGQQRYHDGFKWTEHRAAATPAPRESANPRKVLLIVGLLLAIVVMISVSNNDDDKKSTANTSPTTYTPYPSTAAAAAPTPVGPVKPKGVTFHQEGSVAFAEFQIGDALFMGLTRVGAQSETKEALQWALREYPDATRVFVQGRFPTKDAYGNEENSVVLNVGYDRSTLDKINFANIDNDKIWAVCDTGFVHPDLQG